MPVFFIISTEDMTEVKTFLVRVQMVFRNKFLNTIRPHKVIGIIKINPLNRNLVGSHWLRDK
ncbi:hypothetical protein WP50_28620 [Lactiplantibacillus plantarum]|nr:hypothetical protein WP50_28620 [Lactiplantibacillus plantarum]